MTTYIKNTQTNASQSNYNSSLYNEDYCLWLENTTQILKSGDLSQLDITNLLEEIEDMGKNEKRSLYSNLKILLMHLLKYKYQPAKRSNSWQYTIIEHRQRIIRAFKDSPSLKYYYQEIWHECYQDARQLAIAETGLDADIFSEECPFISEEILKSNYLP